MPTSFFSPSFAPIKGAATSETAPAKNPLPTDLSALAAPAFASFGFLKLQWKQKGETREKQTNAKLNIYIRHTAQLEIDVATLHTFIYSILLIVHVRLRAGRGKHDHNNNRIAEIYIIPSNQMSGRVQRIDVVSVNRS